jgi:hypothetical protein
MQEGLFTLSSMSYMAQLSYVSLHHVCVPCTLFSHCLKPAC